MRALIAYFVRHRTAPNIATVLAVLLGLFSLSLLNVQLWPTYVINRVNVDVQWPGATTSAVDDQIARPLAAALATLENLDSVTTRTRGSSASTQVNFREGTSMQAALADVQAAVASVSTFPDGMRPARIRLQTPTERVARVLVTGAMSEQAALAFSEDLLTRLRRAGLSNLRLSGLTKSPVIIDVDPDLANAAGLTLDELARSVEARLSRESARVSLANGDGLALRVQGSQGLFELRDLPATITDRGLTIGDVARVHRTPPPRTVRTLFEQGNGFFIEVRRTPNEDVLEVANTLTRELNEFRTTLPPTIQAEQYNVRADEIRNRISLLLGNGLAGLALVAITLLLFLNARAALWVAIGIPAAFTIAFGLMWVTGQTINMISVFAMVMILGIIVDDAIVVAEAISRRQLSGTHSYEAAIAGATQMLGPVTTATLTTIAAFAPILMLTDSFGNYVSAIPLFVIVALIASLFECFLLLPGHMRGRNDVIAVRAGGSSVPGGLRAGMGQWAAGVRLRVDGAMRRAARFAGRRIVAPSLRRPLRAFSLAGLIIVFAAVAGSQWVGFRFWLNPVSNFLYVNLTQPRDSGGVEDAVRHYWRALRTIEAEAGYERGELVKATFGLLGRHFADRSGETGPNMAGIFVELHDDQGGRLATPELIRRWRALAGLPAGLQSVEIREFRSGPSGADVHVVARGKDLDRLSDAIELVQAGLASIKGVGNLRNSIDSADPERQFVINDVGRDLGITAQFLGNQVRAATSGVIVEGIADDDGANEVWIRFAADQTDPVAGLAQLPVRTSAGADVTLAEVSDIRLAAAPGRLRRENGELSVQLRADVDATITTDTAVWRELDDQILPNAQALTGVQFEQKGARRDRSRALGEAQRSILIGLACIYLILAWSMADLLRPLYVFVVLPFGAAGAVLGHWIMGYELTMISLVALIALMGILVNDAIILLDEIRLRERRGLSWARAIVTGFIRRFRAVFLTTLTTVVGLVPLMGAANYQAKFLIPIAITLTWGLAIGTMSAFLVIPALMRWLRRPAHTT